MAFHAGRNKTMAGMAGAASLFRVFAWEAGQFSLRIGVAGAAGGLNALQGNRERSVGIVVAVET